MNYHQVKIAFMGGPGVGKTTLLNHFRKMQDATVVDEAARDYFTLYPDADRKAYETQKLLLEHVKERENAAVAFGKKLTVCDRSVVDPPVYQYHFGFEDDARRFIKGLKSYISSYNKLYLLDPEGIVYVQDEVRNESPEERAQIHNAYLDFLAQEKISYVLLSGTLESRIEKVLDDLKEFGYNVESQ